MEGIINFIQNNYIWLIIGIVVIAMTVVGYFAEKTGFSFKDKRNSNDKESEIDEEVQDLNVVPKEEGIADIIRENTEVPSIPAYQEDVSETTPVVDNQEQNNDVPEEAINLEDSNEDLYKPLSTTPEEDTTSEIPDELYAPIDSTPSIDSTEDSNITLENVTPFSMDEENPSEQIEDENSEYSRLFPSDPIIIDGEKKEEPEEEVAQEDIWNV